jgi:hypothetical protein
VLGYVPIGLFAPYTGVPFDAGQSLVPTEQKIRDVARAAGLSYSAFSVEMGTNVNATFPGALPHAGFIKTVGWFQALIYAAMGLFVFNLGASVRNIAARLALCVFGVIIVLFALLLLPPVTRRFRRWRARKRSDVT